MPSWGVLSVCDAYSVGTRGVREGCSWVVLLRGVAVASAVVGVATK